MKSLTGLSSGDSLIIDAAGEDVILSGLDAGVAFAVDAVHNLTIDDLTVATGTALTVDASAATGAVSINGSGAQGALTLIGGAGDDVFTLNGGSAASIDGGAGNDSLRVTMNANFDGFTVTDDPNTTGGMKNVENVELINNGQIARTFSAKGIEGATTYTLKAGGARTGAINLKDLSAAGIAVNVEGLQSGSTSVEFASGALNGTANSLTLGLTNVGTAPTADGDDQTYVNVKASPGLESVTVNASGSNYVNLSEVDAPSFTVNVLDSGAAANVFDGITANILTFNGGSDVDRVSLTGRSGTAIKATLDTGAGDDTVTINGVASTKTITVSGDMGGNTDAITIDASDATTYGVRINISKLGGYSTSKITGVDLQSDTIIGGSGDDEIKAGDVSFDSAICDTLTGGDGADIFKLYTARGSDSTEDGATAIITDFDASEGDELHIGSIGAGTSTNYVEDTTTYTSLSDLLAAADNKLDGTTVNYVAAMIDNDTYIVGTSNLTCHEHEIIVQLQGVSLDLLDDDGSFIKALI